MLVDLGTGKENSVSLDYLANEAQAYRRYNKSYWLSGIEKDNGILKCMERKFSGQMAMDMEG